MPISHNFSTLTLLDGGMGRELQRMGAPFRQPEWSALALMEAPRLVTKAHQAFARAGSEILTTNNYAVVPFHLGEKRFAEQGSALTDLAGALAKEVAESEKALVAGCIPPVFGSYRPDLFEPEKVPPILATITQALSAHADIWLAETIGSLIEARLIAASVKDDPRPLWLSFSVADQLINGQNQALLRSGEKILDATSLAMELGAEAILFNCSIPEVMAAAIKEARQEIGRCKAATRIGVYANAFGPQPEKTLANQTLHKTREDIDAVSYLEFAANWRDLGATLIGGCCGIGPEHIAALNRHLKRG